MIILFVFRSGYRRADDWNSKNTKNRYYTVPYYSSRYCTILNNYLSFARDIQNAFPRNRRREQQLATIESIDSEQTIGHLTRRNGSIILMSICPLLATQNVFRSQPPTGLATCCHQFKYGTTIGIQTVGTCSPRYQRIICLLLVN